MYVSQSAIQSWLGKNRNHHPVGERAFALLWFEKTSKSGSDGGPGKVSLKGGSTTSRKIVTVVDVGQHTNQGSMQLKGLVGRDKHNTCIGNGWSSFGS